MRHWKRCVVSTIFIVISVGAHASTDAWKRFDSSNFSAIYPSAWFRMEGTDRLDILSSKVGAEGVVIKRGQANIFVLEETGYSDKSLSQLINYYKQDGLILSQQELSNYSAGAFGCQSIKEVIFKEKIVPIQDPSFHVPYVIITGFFCEAHGHKLVTVLKNFEGDKRQDEYQKIATRIAKSIRILQTQDSH